MLRDACMAIPAGVPTAEAGPADKGGVGMDVLLCRFLLARLWTIQLIHVNRFSRAGPSLRAVQADRQEQVWREAFMSFNQGDFRRLGAGLTGAAGSAQSHPG